MTVDESCCPLVPVYKDDVHVFYRKQELYQVRDPYWGRACESVSMDDEGSFLGHI